ncbi:hypothetical protein I79_000862 [Cricetulus griseus]|uniref:Uncharacterized protein n=1 Tax=Cricetulus griseus TaxID=10029 RepID=G3GT86_CRIGR|nr:hypothetical protein I79_000862 [Cricetulus griseus]
MFHTPASAICRQPATEKDTSAKCALSPCPGMALLVHFHQRQSKAIYNCALFLNNLFTLL